MELRTLLNGHEGGNPGYGQASVLMGHRASSRPYRGNHNGTHEPTSLSVQAVKLNLFNADGVYDRHKY